MNSVYIYRMNGKYKKYCKIGMSMNPLYRAIDIQVGSPFPGKLYYRKNVKDARKLEKKAQEFASEYGEYVRGEWYKLDKETLQCLIDYIEEYTDD